jgi:hypothetical protein
MVVERKEQIASTLSCKSAFEINKSCDYLSNHYDFSKYRATVFGAMAAGSIGALFIVFLVRKM